MYLSNKDTVIHYTTAGECHVYTYYDADSTARKLIKTIKYNKAGLEVETVLDGFEYYVKKSKSVNIYNTKNQVTAYYQSRKISTLNEIYKTEYQYNAKGNVVKETTYRFDRKIKPGTTIACVVTENDLEKEKTWILHEKWLFYYDASGRLVRKESPKATSEATYEYLYLPNSNKPVEISAYNQNGTLAFQQLYTYTGDTVYYVKSLFNEDGTRKTNSDGKLAEHNVWFEIYNKQGNLVEAYRYNIDEDVCFGKREYFYDSQNRLVKEHKTDSTGKITWTAVYEYQDNSLHTSEGTFPITQH